MRWKSCHVRMKDVAAIPTAANANPTSSAAGNARISQGDTQSPKRAITTRNPMAYSPPRMSAQPISPRATSPTLIGVDRIASYVFW